MSLGRQDARLRSVFFAPPTSLSSCCPFNPPSHLTSPVNYAECKAKYSFRSPSLHFALLLRPPTIVCLFLFSSHHPPLSLRPLYCSFSRSCLSCRAQLLLSSCPSLSFPCGLIIAVLTPVCSRSLCSPQPHSDRLDFASPFFLNTFEAQQLPTFSYSWHNLAVAIAFLCCQVHFLQLSAIHPVFPL